MLPAYHTAFVALGSNLDDRLSPIDAATDRLAALSRTPIVRSHLYDTTPMYLETQPRFVNGVVRLQTELEPEALLAALLAIESSLGRVRGERNGPRVIDLDLLLWDDLIVASEALARVTDNALQIFGGMGLMDDLPIERFWRDARVERIWDGTSEIQRHIISRALLRPLEA
jgi:2-amino-4-hydroxy-6-hydroxymethyldihydropteridine diphosphokinase